MNCQPTTRTTRNSENKRSLCDYIDFVRVCIFVTHKKVKGYQVVICRDMQVFVMVDAFQLCMDD